METNYIDVTGLTSQQVAKIRELVQDFRQSSSQESEDSILDANIKIESEQNLDSLEDKELNKLHEQFSWLVVDLGVKKPLLRGQIYDI